MDKVIEKQSLLEDKINNLESKFDSLVLSLESKRNEEGKEYYELEVRNFVLKHVETC